MERVNRGDERSKVAAAAERDQFVQPPTSLHQRSGQQALRSCQRCDRNHRRRGLRVDHPALRLDWFLLHWRELLCGDGLLGPV